MKRIDACELSRMIEEEYGFEFNIPYHIMEDQKLMDIDVGPQEIDATYLSTLQVDMPKIKDWRQVQPDIDFREAFEFLIDDLCFRKKLKKGSYLMKFDD